MTTVLIRRLCEDIERMAHNSRSGGWSHTAKGPRSPRTVGKTGKEGRKAGDLSTALPTPRRWTSSLQNSESQFLLWASQMAQW